jgi:DNA polymerase-3 subunit beta
MKLVCLQENLAYGLGQVGRAAGRSTLPITNNIKLTTDQGRLKLVATNLEMAISCWIGCDISSEGSITVPAKLITDYVATLGKDDKIELDLDSKNSLNINTGRQKTRLSGMIDDDFPPIPTIDDGLVVKMKFSDLKKAISQVVFAAANDVARPVLTGVLAEFNGDKLNLVAADGFRLAVYKINLEMKANIPIKAIIPARVLNELCRMVILGDDEVTIMINEKATQILFTVGDVQIYSQLIQGSFPAYQQLIPNGESTTITVIVDQFQKNVRTASIFAKDGNGIIKLIATPGADLVPGKLTLNARSEEVGDNVSEMEAIIDGKESKIAFNYKYLNDMLNVIKDDQLILHVVNPTSPGVFLPAGPESFIYVIMPMFVQW